MNKYIVPIADTQAFSIWLKKFSARSFEECENKLMQYLCDKYEELPIGISYTDFIEECDKLDICIGEIVDIDTL